MVLKATATFDTDQQVEVFTRQLVELGVKPNKYRTTVVVEYTGYNNTLYSMLIDIFENERRHEIKTGR